MSHRRCVDRCAWTPAVFVCLVFLVTATIARADVVVPTPDVTTSVSVRASASAQSASVGTLHPGEQATLVGTVSNWYRVQLANGVFGYVSKRWTRIVTRSVPITRTTAALSARRAVGMICEKVKAAKLSGAATGVVQG